MSDVTSCAAAGLSSRAGRGVRAELHNTGGMHAMAITAEARHGSSATADSGVVTVATLARDWARRAPAPGGDAREGPRHLAGAHLGSGLERRARRRPRPARPRHRAGRPRVDPLEDRPEWVVLDIATVAVRAITVGLYPTNPAAEVEYLLGDSGATVHLAEDQEQVDKVFAIAGHRRRARRDRLPRATRARHGYEDARLDSWDDFLELGRRHRAENPGAVEATDGRSGDRRRRHPRVHVGHDRPPKGAMLTNANFAIRRRPRWSSRHERVPDGRPPGPAISSSPTCRCATSPSGSSRRGTSSAPASSSTSPSRSTRSRPTCARSSRPCSSPCRASGRSSTPAS